VVKRCGAVRRRAAGDVDGDGRADIITGPGSGSLLVRLFSGRAGAKLFEPPVYDPKFKGGVRVAVWDVNGDGTPDIVAAPGKGKGQSVRVFDGVPRQCWA